MPGRSKPKPGAKVADKRNVRFMLPSTRRPAAPHEIRIGDWRCPCGNVNFAFRCVPCTFAALLYDSGCCADSILQSSRSKPPMSWILCHLTYQLSRKECLDAGSHVTRADSQRLVRRLAQRLPASGLPAIVRQLRMTASEAA